jgi:hypothetical protein
LPSKLIFSKYLIFLNILNLSSKSQIFAQNSLFLQKILFPSNYSIFHKHPNISLKKLNCLKNPPFYFSSLLIVYLHHQHTPSYFPTLAPQNKTFFAQTQTLLHNQLFVAKKRRCKHCGFTLFSWLSRPVFCLKFKPQTDVSSAVGGGLRHLARSMFMECFRRWGKEE